MRATKDEKEKLEENEKLLAQESEWKKMKMNDN